MRKLKLYGEITKFTKEEDGSLTVIGVASSEAVDAHGEIVTSDAMKSAMPDFFKYGSGNLREMHQPIAAGIVEKADVSADGVTYIEAKVVDSEAIKKVEAGVYKGFSIGGKVLKRDDLDDKKITGIRLSEISLVDRPANPEAVFTMVKIEDDDEGEQVSAVDALAELLNKGEITPERLLELAKAEMPAANKQTITPLTNEVTKPVEGAEKIEDSNTGDQVEKGLYTVADFADLLARVKWLCDDTAWEAEYEGDDSELPAKLKEWLGKGLKLLAAMLKEEAGEIMANADSPEDLSKVEQPKADDTLAKLQSDLSAMSEKLAKVLDTNTTLQERITKLESKPAPGKALLKAIAKSEDLGEVVQEDDQVNKVAPVRDAHGQENEAATLIKMIHQQARLP